MMSEQEYIDMEINRAGGGSASLILPKQVIEEITKTAKKRYARLLIQREEWLDVKRHYELWANSSLKVIKKTPAPRKVLTVTIPARMMDRLNGLPRGNKSAYVTRLMARGWLSQMEGDE